MINIVNAAVSRSASGNQITYTTTMGTTYTKAYWAIYEPIPVGCAVSFVSCAAGNLGCGYVSSDKSIRAVGYTQEAGGAMPSSIVVTVTGAGSCSLSSGLYIESYTGSLGSSTAISGSATLTLKTCNTPADGIIPSTICDGCVSDSEFPYAVNSWKQQTGIISDIMFPTVVNNWKTRNGC